MLEAEKNFLAILEKIWQNLSWRKWSKHNPIPNIHFLNDGNDQGNYLWYKNVETIIEFPEGVFQITIKLASQDTGFSYDHDPFERRHYFSITLIDSYNQSGRKKPINIQSIEPGDEKYEFIKNLFFLIQEEAMECNTCRDITRDDAAKTINTIFRNHFALV